MRKNPLFSSWCVLLVLAACGPDGTADGVDEVLAIENEIFVPATAIPGTLQAERFRVGREGETWHDTTPTANLGGEYRPRSGVDIGTADDTGGGFYVGWIEPGEWLTYELKVRRRGTFDIAARVASGVTGTKTFRIRLADGTRVGGASFTDAGGYQRWRTVAAGSVTLAAGTHVIKVQAVTGGFNLNHLTFGAADESGGGGGDGDGLPRSTLTGSSVNGRLFTDLGRAKVAVTRAYLRGLGGATWDASDIRDAIKYSSDTVWISFKEDDPALVDKFLAAKPATVTQRVVVTYFHEPEDNIKTDSAKAAYRATWQKMGPIIRKHGMIPALILMKYTLNKGSGRNWRDYYPEGAVDLLGWDSYRKGDANDYDLSSQIDPIVAVSQQTGLPWGIGETGSTSVRYSAADTARWAAALRAYGAQKGAMFMCWWDQDSFKLDAATAKAWLD